MMTGAQLQAKFDTEWTWATKYAASHPKTAMIVSLVAGFVLAHFI